MPDTIDKIAHQVLLSCPLAGKPLATLWASNAFAKLADGRNWSWRYRFSQFVIKPAYAIGTVTITSADPTLIVGGGGASWTPDMVGMQFNVGYSFGYDLVEFIDSTHMRISMPWGDVDQINIGYQFRSQYVVPPADFLSFDSVIDTTRNYKIRTGVERREIDRRDPRRTTTGIPYVIAEAGYSPAYAGTVDTLPFQVAGSGPSPVMGGAFSGPADALYVIQILVGGASGVATFQYKRGVGAWSAPLTTDTNPIALTGGITASFPTAVYVANDIFVARAKASASFGIPRFEFWPVQLTQTVYPYYYLAQPPDLTSLAAATLPSTIPGYVVLEGALAEAYGWPGRGSEANKMYDMKAMALKLTSFGKMIDIQALKDDEIFPKDVSYYRDLPFAGPPWDAAWEQRHDGSWPAV